MNTERNHNLYSVCYTIRLVAALNKETDCLEDSLLELLTNNIEDIVDNSEVATRADLVTHEDELPDGWDSQCLPYLVDPTQEPQHTQDTTIKGFWSSETTLTKTLERICALEKEIVQLKQSLRVSNK